MSVELKKLSNNIFLRAIEQNKQKQIESNAEPKSSLSQDIDDLNKFIENKDTVKSVCRDLSDAEIEAMIENEEKAKAVIPQIVNEVAKLADSIVEFWSNTANGSVESLPLEATPIDLYISTSSGKINRSAAVNDTYNINVSFGGNNFQYSLKSSIAQDISFEVSSDGRLVVSGSQLSIVTADNQYSNVMLLGQKNELKVGANGQVHLGNNLYYQKIVGSSAVTKWGEDIEDLPVSPTESEGYNFDINDISDNNKITLTRKNTYADSATDTVSRTLGSDEKILVTLTNPFTGTDYQYTIKNTSNNEQEVTLQFLMNGRLVVDGNYLEILAGHDQQDDMILQGQYCAVYTGNMSDTVRDGFVIDANSSYYTKTLSAPTNNIVYTGSGDDYLVSSIRVSNEGNMGAGDDKFMSLYNYWNTYSGAESIRDYNNKSDDYDYIDGWAGQAQSSDCQIFSLLNSLGKCGNKLNISDYITISENNSNYTVTFNNFIPTDGSVKTVTFPAADVENYNGVNGDLDTVIFNYAINQLIHANNPELDNGDDTYWLALMNRDGEDAARQLLSNYILGNSSQIEYTYTNWNSQGSLTAEQFSDKLLNLWDLYQSNKISNLNFSFPVFIYPPGKRQTSDYTIGKVVSHAFAIKNIDFAPDGTRYIELVNPWDDADVVRFSWNYLFDGESWNNGNSNACNGLSVYVLGYDDGTINNLIAANTQSAINFVTQEPVNLTPKVALSNPFAAKFIG